MKSKKENKTTEELLKSGIPLTLGGKYQIPKESLLAKVLTLNLTNNIVKTWADIEKSVSRSPQISVSGTTPDISQRMTEPPSVGTTLGTKRKWLNKLLDITTAEGYDLDGYTMSIFPPKIDLHYKRKAP